MPSYVEVENIYVPYGTYWVTYENNTITCMINRLAVPLAPQQVTGITYDGFIKNDVCDCECQYNNFQGEVNVYAIYVVGDPYGLGCDIPIYSGVDSALISYINQ